MIVTEKTLADKIVRFIKSNNEGAALGIKNMAHWDLETVIDFMVDLLNKGEKNGHYVLEWIVDER